MADGRAELFADAVISDDGQYRYRLTRRWDAGMFGERLPPIVWVMLNPSTADHEFDDPTIRRCMTFSRTHGYAAMHVVNLYAYRSPNPALLGKVSDPVGPDNDQWIADTIAGASVVVAWGVSAAQNRVDRFAELAVAADLWCLGTTRGGMPRHPLYVPGATRFERWMLP